MINYPALKTEVLTDPQGYGYAAPLALRQDGTIASLLNLARAAIQVDVTTLPVGTVLDAIVPSEWRALTADLKQQIDFVLKGENINVKSANVRLAFTDAFAAGTTTRTNLLALLTRNGSRAEQLFGAGTTLSADDVSRALLEE